MNTSLIRIYYLRIKLEILKLLLRIATADVPALWRLNRFAFGFMGWVVAILLYCLLGCQPKPKPAATVKPKPAAVDSTRLRREQKVQAAKQSLQADQDRANSAVTDYENAVENYKTLRVPMP